MNLNKCNSVPSVNSKFTFLNVYFIIINYYNYSNSCNKTHINTHTFIKRLAKTRQNQQKLAKTRQNPSKLGKTRQNLLKPVKTCQNPSKPSRTRQNSSKPAKTRQNLPKLVKTRQSPPKLAKTCQNLSKPAKTRRARQSSENPQNNSAISRLARGLREH